MTDVGRANEERVRAHIERHRGVLDVLAVRLATSEEDSLGVDIVVTTRQGLKPLQVKSSKKGAQRFRRFVNGVRIPVVTVLPDTEDGALLQAITVALSIAPILHAHRAETECLSEAELRAMGLDD